VEFVRGRTWGYIEHTFRCRSIKGPIARETIVRGGGSGDSPQRAAFKVQGYKGEEIPRTYVAKAKVGSKRVGR